MHKYHIPFGYRESGKYTISFFETSVERLVKELLNWGAEYDWSYHYSIVPDQFLKNKQFTELDNLARTNLLIPTRNSWTAHVDNDILGSYPQSKLYVLAERLRIRTVSFVFDSISAANLTKRPYGILFLCIDGRDGGKAKERSVTLVKDSSWEFYVYGDSLEFEQIEAYEERLKKNRLTPQMLINYANSLGIDIESPDYYRISDAVLAQKYLTDDGEDETNRLIQELADIGFEFGATSVQILNKDNLESENHDE